MNHHVFKMLRNIKYVKFDDLFNFLISYNQWMFGIFAWEIIADESSYQLID